MNNGKSKVLEMEVDNCENRPLAQRREMARGQSSIQHEATACGTEQPVITRMCKSDDSMSDKVPYCKIQETNNIFRAVYREIMTIACKANYFVRAVPSLGSIEELQKVFWDSPPSDMRLETSTETAIVPIHARTLCINMMELDVWHGSMSHIFHYVGGCVPDGVYKHLKEEDPSILHVEMVNGEFQLPILSAAVRRFSFLRFLKEIIANELWAIIDVSEDYFRHIDIDNLIPGKCRRRPSGIIIRARDDKSEIIWIENVEVPKQSQFQDNICSPRVNLHEAFSAKRWVNALLWSLKRSHSTFFIQEIKWGRPYYLSLLALTNNMRLNFMKFLRGSPDDEDWTILTDHGMRIIKDAKPRYQEACKLCSYVGVVRFRIQAKPHVVFQYLIKKSQQIQWLLLLDEKEAEEVVRFAADDESNVISLYRRNVILEGGRESEEFLLQEASWDGFSYLITSAIMTQADAYYSLIARYKDVELKPSGFAIVPDGCDSCLVTCSLLEDLQIPDAETGIKIKSFTTQRAISEIMEDFGGVISAVD